MSIFDFTDGDFLMDMGSGITMDTEGHLMQSMGSGMAMDLETGDLHLIDSSFSSWSNSEDNDNWYL